MLILLNYFGVFRKVAAKLEGGGSKRPLEEGSEPNAKKLASAEVQYQQQAMR